MSYTMDNVKNTNHWPTNAADLVNSAADFHVSLPKLEKAFQWMK